MRQRSRLMVLTLVLAAALLPGVHASAGTEAGGTKAGGAEPDGGVVFVGAASRTVLPTVDGSTSYLDGHVPDPVDATSLGAFVPRFDQGRVGVSNGDDRAFWVHDDLRVRAMVIDDPRAHRPVVLVSTDLYMVFRVDGDQIRAAVAQRLASRDGNGRDKRVELLIAATHNHHGPDTAFGVNHSWYEYLIKQTTDAVTEALDNRRPARLRVASGAHWFGAHDGVDPIVYDPTMNVLQAVETGSGKPIATVVQWNNHPEVTLNWRPPAPAADCAALQAIGESCETRGRYFTADFPGVLAERVRAAVGGGEVLYLNGAVGDLTGPGGTQVWEVDAAHPLGDQVHAPAGALAAGGGNDYTARNFRRAVIIGEQAASAALKLLANASPVGDARVSYVEEVFYTRMSNRGFRYLLVPGADGRPQGLGHNLPQLYTCPAAGPKNAQTCVADGGAAQADPVFGRVRVGDHARSAVGYLRIGQDISLVMLPGEVAGELVMGLPAGFRSTPQLWYEEPEVHVAPEDFHIPGYVRARVPGRYLFTVGLGNDELGYVKSITDYRIGCVADQLAGPGTCAALHQAGAIEFPDGVAGTTCKTLTEDPGAVARLAQIFGEAAAQAVVASCTYGQAIAEADGHYPETNSAGWDMAADMLAAVGRLTGNHSTQEVNPDFPGHNDEFPPPVA